MGSSGYCSCTLSANLISNASHQPLHIPDRDSKSHGTLVLFLVLLWKLRDFSTSVVASGSSMGWCDKLQVFNPESDWYPVFVFHQFSEKYKHKNEDLRESLVSVEVPRDDPNLRVRTHRKLLQCLASPDILWLIRLNLVMWNSISNEFKWYLMCHLSIPVYIHHKTWIQKKWIGSRENRNRKADLPLFSPEATLETIHLSH